MHHTRETYKHTEKLGQDESSSLHSGKLSFVFDIVSINSMFPTGATSHVGVALTQTTKSAAAFISTGENPFVQPSSC